MAIKEVLDDAVEAFGTGTAAGVTYFSSIRHGEREQVFGDGAIGPVAHAFRSRLKGVQYGALEDRYGWMVPVAAAADGAGDAAGAAAAAVAAEGVAAAEGAADGSTALAGTARG